MAQADFAAVLSRVNREPGFANQLKTDPDTALAGFSLTSAELTALKSIDVEQLSLITDAISSRVRGTMASTNACIGREMQ